MSDRRVRHYWTTDRPAGRRHHQPPAWESTQPSEPKAESFWGLLSATVFGRPWFWGFYHEVWFSRVIKARGVWEAGGWEGGGGQQGIDQPPALPACPSSMLMEAVPTPSSFSSSSSSSLYSSFYFPLPLLHTPPPPPEPVLIDPKSQFHRSPFLVITLAKGSPTQQPTLSSILMH